MFFNVSCSSFHIKYILFVEVKKNHRGHLPLSTANAWLRWNPVSLVLCQIGNALEDVAAASTRLTTNWSINGKSAPATNYSTTRALNDIPAEGA
jgi:hypothetical protein